MPNFLKEYFRGYHRLAHIILTILLLLTVTLYNWVLGISGFVIYSYLLYVFYRKEDSFANQLESYLSTLTHRIKKAGEDVISELPIGIILYDEDRKIQWYNQFLTTLLDEEVTVGKTLEETIPNINEWLGKEEEEGTIRYRDRVFSIHWKKEERLLYIVDKTEYHQLQVKHRQGKSVFLHIHLDNLDEVTQGMSDEERIVLTNDVTRTISQWAQTNGIYLKRTGTDKFFGVMDEQTLRDLEENKFDILDQVRELTSQNKLPVTLSIGVGAGSDSFLEMGELSNSSLELALGRGGDQVAVKRTTGKIMFYGGKSNAIEKRTRVRARVIAHALRNIIRESDQVFIMGHRDPDMDSIGAAIGILKTVELNGKEGFIILDHEQKTIGIDRLMKKIEEKDTLIEKFMSPLHALERKTDKSLLIMVDVHKPSMVMDPKLIDSIGRRVVIDHHRRGEEFIPDPLLVYMEPYASSTSELVTELLEYQGGQVELTEIEATAMLTGIVVDTKHFAFRTGSRTYDAASYLRHHGANQALVQELLKEDKNQFVKRAEIVGQAEIYRHVVAISVTDVDERYGQVLLAQAADTLLTLEQIIASFVIGKREDGTVTISARSLGELNVQMIMEKMNGGGHLTNAATQLEDTTVEDALQWLKQNIDDYFEGSETS